MGYNSDSWVGCVLVGSFPIISVLVPLQEIEFAFKGNQVRTDTDTDENGTIWLCAKDICNILDYADALTKQSVKNVNASDCETQKKPQSIMP